MAIATVTVRSVADGTKRQYHLTVPDPPQTGFAFGLDIAANDIRKPGGSPSSVQWSYARVTTALRRDGGSRLKFFDGGAGIAKAVQMWQATGAREPHPLLSIQQYTPADLNHWMDSLHSQVGLCLKQEFTRDLAAAQPPYTPDDLSAWYADLRHIIDAHPNGHFVDLQMVGSEAPERKASSPWWAKVRVPERCAIGNDAYIQEPALLDPARAYKASVDWFNAVRHIPGVTLRISESGVSRTRFTPAQRIKFLQDSRDYLVSVGASSYNYWTADNSSAAEPGKDWSTDKPGDESVAAKLASLITA